MNFTYTIPSNTSEEIRQKIENIRTQLRDSHKIARSMIISPTGNVIWEENIDDYNKRMGTKWFTQKLN